MSAPSIRNLKIVAIGNSRSIRLPKSLLDKYAITDTVMIEEREDGFLLRSKHESAIILGGNLSSDGQKAPG